MSLDAIKSYMTYEAFLAWADEDTHAEWVAGKVVYKETVSDDDSWARERQAGHAGNLYGADASPAFSL